MHPQSSSKLPGPKIPKQSAEGHINADMMSQRPRHSEQILRTKNSPYEQVRPQRRTRRHDRHQPTRHEDRLQRNMLPEKACVLPPLQALPLGPLHLYEMTMFLVHPISAIDFLKIDESFLPSMTSQQ